MKNRNFIKDNCAFYYFCFIFLYLPIVFIFYFILNKLRFIRIAIAFLVLASIFFYGYWNYIYVPLIIASFTFNFFVGSKLCAIAAKFEGQEKNKKPKGFLAFGILANIALLGYYKYTDFFIENFNGIFSSFMPLMHVILPLGIGFFLPLRRLLFWLIVIEVMSGSEAL